MRKSWHSSGGAFERQRTTESTIAWTTSSIDARTSSGESVTVLGRPETRSRPRTSAWASSGVGAAEPMATLISSAVRSPMAMPYSLRTYSWMAASRSKLPTRTASSATMPPSEITAVSLVPPPMSITIEPTGSLIGRPAPIAAAIGWAMSCGSAAPAFLAASVTARFSTSVIADGTQMSTRGRLNRLTPTRCKSNRIMRSVMSKSVIAPPRKGRTATM